MDPVRLKVLQAEIQAQQKKMERVFELLEKRFQSMAPENPAQVESLAYQLHNLYNAVEDLMKLVASAFENSVTDLSRWHTQPLNRMTLEIEGVRPTLFKPESAERLHELRTFRHFFRHAYGIELDPGRVEKNLDKARQLRPLLKRDVEVFLQALESAEKG